MSALPVGEDIPLVAGTSYDLLASVSKNFSAAEIHQRVPSGVVVEDFREQGDGKHPPLGPDPNPHHRFVQARIRVDRDAGTLPWKSPWPTTIFTLVSASSSNTLQSRSKPPNVWPWVGVVTAALAGLAWWQRGRWHGLGDRIFS
jgi:hypothetical protein